MNILIDLLLLAILILCIWMGKKRGFIKSFFGFFGSIIAFFLTSLFAKPLGSFFSSAFFYPFLRQRFLTVLSQEIGQSASGIDFSALPESCQQLLARFGTDAEAIADHVATASQTVGDAAADTVSGFVALPLADAASYALAFFLLFVVFSVAVRIAVHLLDLISKLPILNFSNRFLGLLAGALQGFFLVLVLSAILVSAAPWIGSSPNPFLASFDPEQTYLLKFLSGFDFFGMFSITKG
ncbi:MAG: CvpA family protein [Clostridia bacterium]|nr:CvpA family protein [Clostridia bacterium]